MPSPAPIRRCLRLFALLAVVVQTAPALAASAKGEFGVKGLGADSCAAFVEASRQKAPSVGEFGGWVEGYITAVNRYRPDTFDIAPWQSTGLLLGLIHAHCQQNPDHRLFDVVHQLQVLLAEDRLTARSEITEASNGKDRVRIYAEVLKRAQQALIDRGLLQGTADGVFGPKTRTAFEALQKKVGLPVTGLPDQETLFELLLRPRLAGTSASKGAPARE